MKIIWLGHSSFRIETGDEVLLIDPWLRGNPSFDESRFDEAIAGYRQAEKLAPKKWYYHRLWIKRLVPAGS